MNCILAIDYGTVRMGFAISDESKTLARSLSVFLVQKFNVYHHIQTLVKQYSCERILIGLPINLNNKETKKTKEVRTFASSLLKYITVPIEFQNEALTSYEANFILRHLGFHSYKKRNKKKDSMSAQILLQDYLNAKSCSSL